MTAEIIIILIFIFFIQSVSALLPYKTYNDSIDHTGNQPRDKRCHRPREE